MKKKLTGSVLYYNSASMKSMEDKVIIGDVGSLGCTPNTLDVKFSELATNEEALVTLNLVGTMASKPEAVEFLAFYLACFYPKTQEAYQARLLTDPVLRVCILSERKMAKFAKALGLTPNKYPDQSSDFASTNYQAITDYINKHVRY